MNYSACYRVHALVRQADELQKEAGFWDGVGSFARGGVNALKGFGSAAGNALTAIPQTMMSAGKGFLTGEGGGLMGGMRDVGNKIQGGFSQGLQGMGQMARPMAGAAQSMGQGVMDAGNAVGQGLNTAGQAIGGAVHGAGQAIGGAANAVGQQAQQAGQGVWSDIMKGWNGGAQAPAGPVTRPPGVSDATWNAPGAASLPNASPTAAGPGIPAPGQTPVGTGHDQTAVNHVSSVPRAQGVAPWEDPRFFGAY